MLRHFWREHPNWRLGQVVSNAAHITGWQSNDVFYVEDSKIWWGLGLMTGEELKRKRERDEAVSSQESNTED